MPYKTGLRLLGVARNPANGFPARLLGSIAGDAAQMQKSPAAADQAPASQPRVLGAYSDSLAGGGGGGASLVDVAG